MTFLSAPLLSVEEIARLLSISKWSVRRLIPKLGSTRVGGLIRVPRQNLEDMLRGAYTPPVKTESTRRRRGEPGTLGVLVDAAFGKAKGSGR